MEAERQPGRHPDRRTDRHRGGSSNRRRLAVSVRVRLSPEDAARIAASAKAADVSVSELIRRATLGTSDQPAAKTRLAGTDVELARILAQLGKMGSNLNQIARAANSGGWPSEPEMIEGAAAVRATCGEIIRALGRHP